MTVVAALLVLLVALEHVGLALLETVYWTRAPGLWMSGLAPEAAQAAAGMARNQAIVNGFLAAALLWTFTVRIPARRRNLRIVLLIGVLVAAGFGGIASRPLVFIAQGVPAVVTFLFVRFADEWSGRA